MHKMQPQQPYYQPPATPGPDNTGQYDFIVNNNVPSKRPASKNMLLVVVGAAVLVIVLAWIILSLAFGGSSSATAPLVTIAQEQTEIVRIAKLADDSSHLSSQDTRNFSKTTRLTVGSDQAKLVAFLAKNGKKLNEKQLAGKQSATTDAALDAAATSGTYDSTLVSTLQTQLKTYQTSLQQAFTGATSSSEKTLLKAEFDNATLLIEQSTQRN
ncbi:MAG: hypothetical protein ABIR37_01220 [Candidatus Saccharimonadales bacterium]